MPLSMKEPIRAEDISAVKELKDGKVFLLTGHKPPVGEPERIVIKGEYLGANAHDVAGKMKSGAIAARLIDPDAEVKPLSAVERAALMSFAANFEELNKRCAKEPSFAGTDSGGAVTSLCQSLKSPIYRWVKMKVQNLTTLEQALVQRANGDKTSLQRFTDALKAPGGLEKMGRVVAADSFIGNVDRICTTLYGNNADGSRVARNLLWTSDPSASKGTPALELKLKTFGNLGNIIVAAADPKGKRFEASLLDYLDPNSNQGNVDRDIDAEYAMHCLGDEVTRKAFVTDVIQDFETVLRPGRSRFDFSNTTLGANAEARFEAGLIDGCKAILNHFENRVMHKAPSPNLQRRLNLLRKTVGLSERAVDTVQHPVAPQKTLIGSHRLRLGAHRLPSN